MAYPKIVSPTSLSATNNIITTSCASKYEPATTNNVLQQLQQLQRITQQMPIFMGSSKTTTPSANSNIISTTSAAVTTNNVFQQLQQLQLITQQIAPSKTTSLSANSNIIPTISAPKSGAATMNNMQQPLEIIEITPITTVTEKSSATLSLSATSNIITTSSATKSIAATTNKVHQQHRKQQGPVLSYILYLQLEEMRRPKSTKLRKAKAKYQLTHELISKTMRTVHKLSPADLEIISQQTIYKKNLEREIATENHKKYMENYQKQQKAKFPKKQQQKQFLPQQYGHHQPIGNVEATPMEGIQSPGYFSYRT